MTRPARLLARPLTPDDLAQWRAFRAAGLAAHPEAFLTTGPEDAAVPDADVAAMLARRMILGLWQDAVLVGSVAMDPEPHPRQSHRIWFNAVYLAPHLRGRGVARGLIGQAMDLARSMGFLQAELYHAAENTGAARSYAALGFREVGRVPRAVRFGDGFQDDVHLVANLDGAEQ